MNPAKSQDSFNFAAYTPYSGIYGRIYCVEERSIYAGKRYNFVIDFAVDQERVVPSFVFIDRLIPSSTVIIGGKLQIAEDVLSLEHILKALHKIINFANITDIAVSASSRGKIVDIEKINDENFDLAANFPFKELETSQEEEQETVLREFLKEWKKSAFDSGVDRSLVKIFG